ncbi:VgrG-related protein [Actinosynnema sp. NPDC023658]|uniref:VgrG-related protein n=1 Tax=Actinosynnema sp. NPDC023658 TaxID=3155465 RepID=UPI00340F336B
MSTPNAEGDNLAASAVVKVNGNKLGDEAKFLVRCVVDENVGLPDTAVLVYRDADRELLRSSGIRIGSEVEVLFATSTTTAAERVFTGEVTALEMDYDNPGVFVVVRATSRAHRLMRGRKVQAFRNMSASTVVRKVAAGAGLTVGRLDVANVVYRHLSQAGVSDWDFLQQLALEHDAVVRIDGGGLLEFVKLVPASKAPKAGSSDPHVLKFGRNTHSLRAVLTTADQANGVEVRSWDVATKKALVAVQPNTPSKTVKPGLTASRANAKFPTKAPLLVTDTPYATQAEATRAARSLEASTGAGFGELEAVVEGNPQLRAGDPVTVADYGDDFDGSYTVTGARHVLDPELGYQTTLTVSASYDRSLAGLVTGGNAPVRSGRMPGLATGIVTDIKEPGRDQRGWVRLKFPWLDDNYVTDWVRTVQWGGVGGGGVFSPEVDDEVLVGFEQGSLDRPYVIGGLYNGVDKPSPHGRPLVDALRGKVNRRSVSARNGNRLELLDSRAASGVRLVTGDERLEVVLDDKLNQVEVSVRGPKGVRVLSSVTLTSTGATIKAGTGSVTLDGSGITIDAGLGVLTLKGTLIKLN